jgi:mono/diheme cytochrome c family protein
VLGVAAAIACARGGGPPPSPAEVYQGDPAALRRGRLLFTGTCGGYCHPTKPANRDAPYLFDCSWKHGGSDLEIFASIAHGVPDTRMPAWQGKMPDGDEDIWKVIAYLRSRRSCVADT